MFPAINPLFPILFGNGYECLPNKHKACVYPGWSTITITETLAQRWTQQTRFQAIGVRIRGELLVFDFDGVDPVLMVRMEDVMRETMPSVLEAHVMRIGRTPAYFARYDGDGELFRYAASGKWSFAPEDPKADYVRLEVFGGGSKGRQFGVFGAHSLGPDGITIERAYSWPGRSLVDIPRRDLPGVTKQQILALCAGVDAVFASTPGLENVSGGKRNVAAFQPKQVFDLKPEAAFETEDGSTYTVEELADWVRAEHKRDPKSRVMVTGSFTGDKSSSGSDRCLCSIGEHGLSIWDSKTDTTHHLIGADQSKSMGNVDLSDIAALLRRYGLGGDDGE